jgi:TRAP transporter 4TM/12TM fusion protein
MPPIMGAGAFIMAEILGIPYSRVAIGAAIPAILYYMGCYFSIHFEAQRLRLKPVPSEMIPSFRKDILPWSLPFILPVVVLVYFLSTGYSPTLSVLYSILISTVWYLITARSLGTLKTRVRQVLQALEDGGKAVILVAALCACAQIVVSMFNMTGLGIRFTEAVVELSRGSMFFTLIMGMIICLILGMGIPTTAAYVLAASVVAPSLVTLGAPILSAHLFIFYFAIISAITPPVCAAVYVAAAIAHSNWWRTGWISVRFGASGFIVPFMFFYMPTLLLFGEPGMILFDSFSASIGVYALSAGVVGFLLGPLSWLGRLILITAALLLITPGVITDSVGFAMLAAIYFTQRFNLSSIFNLRISGPKD